VPEYDVFAQSMLSPLCVTLLLRVFGFGGSVLGAFKRVLMCTMGCQRWASGRRGQYLLSGLRLWDSRSIALFSTIATSCSPLGYHAFSQRHSNGSLAKRDSCACKVLRSTIHYIPPVFIVPVMDYGNAIGLRKKSVDASPTLAICIFLVLE
jgi:hypothetical protein